MPERHVIIPGQRSVLFDTETTGLDPASGDRILEIAAIELVRDLPTARFFHALIDPERDVPDEATRVHGYTRSHVMGQPRFADIVDAFLDFLGDAPLVAHNAEFDFAFVNAELARLALPPLQGGRMIDTLALAKARFPGMPNSLNALCNRFAIDLSERTTHNALLDCRLLAQVYVELTGGRQAGLPTRGPCSVPQTGGPCWSNGRCTARATPGPAAARRAATPSRAVPTPLARCCGSFWTCRDRRRGALPLDPAGGGRPRTRKLSRRRYAARRSTAAAASRRTLIGRSSDPARSMA